MRNGPFPSSAGQGRSALSARPAVAVDGEERTATSKPSPSTPARFGGRILIALLAFASMLALAPSSASAQGESKRVLHLHRHHRLPPHRRRSTTAGRSVQAALEAARLHGRLGGLHRQRRRRRPTATTPTRTRAIFTDDEPRAVRRDRLPERLRLFSGTGGTPGPLWNDAAEGGDHQVRPERRRHRGDPQRDRHGRRRRRPGTGGTATTRTRSSARTMPGHARPTNNNRDGQVADHNHLSTRDLPDTYGFGDEHYNCAPQRPRRPPRARERSTSARTTRAATRWARTTRSRGASCYDGDNVERRHRHRRRRTTTAAPGSPAMGHIGASYTENGGNNNLVKHDRRRRPLGRGRGHEVRLLAAPSGRTSRAPSSSPTRTTRSASTSRRTARSTGPRSAPTQGFTSEGYVKMHDPEGPANNKTTVATIPTRADHGNSEDGVLGMSLEPGLRPRPTRPSATSSSTTRRATRRWPTTGNAAGRSATTRSAASR